MRLKTYLLAAAISVLIGATPPRAAAQNPDTMMPEASAAKAKQLLQQLIQGLGGPAYLQVRESMCEGRLAQFGHNGDLMGYVNFKDFWRYPDKNRTEYGKKGEIVDLYSGDSGWTLDKGGISEEPASAVTDFQERTKRDINNLLRLRLKEEGMAFRYGGGDIADLKQVDWVEMEDRERRIFRIAIDRATHLPLRSLVVTRDDATRERTEDLTVYASFHIFDGVQTALQISRARDGRRAFQAFYNDCKYNPGIPDELFTRASLEQHYAQVGKKKKK